ncbi:general stress protein [Mobilicoccus pelagius]|uniref:General stress protein 17M-like domain-containing protein n=1 Tax=Mobilicoccus pelagius NBRC 104925 TaxID=1089455 RepID=H5URP4_9MICO|nr:general stress protein [Mobilicoccus pelagius]GAB48402.1 hypothetical protein MOPEL_073_00420 [Mobilicoccus pelagius NBRC 104925]
MGTQPGMPGHLPMAKLQLTNPRSLAVYDSYEDAQRAVDYLSDHGFAVQNVMIVGTDLKQVERVTGRMSWGKAVGSGALSGMWVGLMVGLLMSMFGGGADTMARVTSSVVAGAFFLAVWAGIGYAVTQGKRDFTSVSQVVATRYEILVEQATFADADRILRGPTGGAGAAGTHEQPTGPRRDDELGRSGGPERTPTTDETGRL